MNRNNVTPQGFLYFINDVKNQTFGLVVGLLFNSYLQFTSKS